MSMNPARAGTIVFLLGLAAAVGPACGNKGSSSSGLPAQPPPPADLPGVPASETGDEPATTTVTGSVVDEGGLPVAGAVVDDGATNATSDATGAFQLATKTGRVTFHVVAKGFLELRQMIPIVDGDAPHTIHLLSKASAQTVGAGGAKVSAGSMTLTYAPGAYAADTPVVARWIDGAHIGSTPRRVRWMDDAGRTFKTLGVVHVEAPAEPTVPVSVRVPLPAGVTTVAYYPIDRATGERQGPIAPTDVAPGFATFAVPHFDDGEVATPGDPGSATLQSGTSTATASDGTTTTVNAGDDVPPSTPILAATPEPPALVYPDGSLLTVTRGSITYVQSLDTGATVECPDCDLTVEKVRGSHSVTPPPSTRFRIRTKTAVMGVRGTVVRVATNLCRTPDGRTVDEAHVPEGTVDVTGSGADFTLTGGQRAKTCDSCADPHKPVCCDGSNCGAGCCDGDGRCNKAVSAAACGIGGSACIACAPCNYCFGGRCQLVEDGCKHCDGTYMISTTDQPSCTGHGVARGQSVTFTVSNGVVTAVSVDTKGATLVVDPMSCVLTVTSTNREVGNFGLQGGPCMASFGSTCSTSSGGGAPTCCSQPPTPCTVQKL